MIFQRVNRSDPERVFLVMRNNQGATAAKDDAAQLELASASIDGVRVRQPQTNLGFAFIGITDASTTDGSYGLVQVYGYRSTSKVFQTNTSQDTGVALVPTAAAAYLSSVATSTTSSANVTQQPIFAVLGESIASSSASATISAKVFIRAL